MKRNCDFTNPNRHELKDVVPLSTPYKINIEPSNLCNIYCQFCPTADRKLVGMVRKQGVMSFDLFRKIVKDFHEFDRQIEVVEFFIDGEPLVNKNFPEMARHLWSEQVAKVIRVKTNGLLLNPPLIERLAKSYLSRIDISIVAPDEAGYWQIAKAKMDYRELINNVKLLYRMRGDTQLFINMRETPYFSPDDIEKFYTTFEGMSDFIAVEKLHKWSGSDVMDLSLGLSEEPTARPIVCPWPLFRLAINWNGLVRTCTVDWAWETTIGDVSVNSVKQIWDGLRLYQFRQMHLEGRRADNPACGNCALINERLDNVDASRFEILERLQKA